MNQKIIFVSDFPFVSKAIYTVVYDIGGTNCNAGLFIKNDTSIRPVLIVQYKSQEFSDPYDMILAFCNYLVQTYEIFKMVALVVAAAGIVSDHGKTVVFTNLGFVLEKDRLQSLLPFNCPIVIMNDFEVIFHGISLIDQSKLIFLVNRPALQEGMIGIIGAGTGLGKSIVGFDHRCKSYTVFCSEGGHQAFAASTQEEYELVNYIKKTEKRSFMVTWEDLLSGNGIGRIYHYFVQKYSDENSSEKPYPHPDEIFNERFRDKACFETYNLYVRLYARCIREFSLEILPFGGLYIAGGIAAHNSALFQSDSFMQEFLSHAKHKTALSSIPLIVIADYYVSLYGAAWNGFDKGLL